MLSIIQNIYLKCLFNEIIVGLDLYDYFHIDSHFWIFRFKIALTSCNTILVLILNL